MKLSKNNVDLWAYNEERRPDIKRVASMYYASAKLLGTHSDTTKVDMQKLRQLGVAIYLFYGERHPYFELVTKIHHQAGVINKYLKHPVEPAVLGGIAWLDYVKEYLANLAELTTNLLTAYEKEAQKCQKK